MYHGNKITQCVTWKFEKITKNFEGDVNEDFLHHHVLYSTDFSTSPGTLICTEEVSDRCVSDSNSKQVTQGETFGSTNKNIISHSLTDVYDFIYLNCMPNCKNSLGDVAKSTPCFFLFDCVTPLNCIIYNNAKKKLITQKQKLFNYVFIFLLLHARGTRISDKKDVKEKIYSRGLEKQKNASATDKLVLN